jgi:hypothetical protein
MTLLGPCGLALILVAGATACVANPEHPPSSGGGLGSGGASPGGSSSSDAGPGGQPDIAGTLCQAVSLLDPLACPIGINFAEVPVEAGGRTTTAAADGRFELGPVAGASAVIVAGAGDSAFRKTAVQVALDSAGTADLQIPLVRDEDWAELRAVVGFGEGLGDASVVVYPVDDRTLAPLAGVSLQPIAGTAHYYDDGAALEWDQDQAVGTGQSAVILVTGVAVTSPSLQLTLQHGEREHRVSVPIRAEAVTFATVSVPAP